VRRFLLFHYRPEPLPSAPHPAVGAQPPAPGAGLLGCGGPPPPGIILLCCNPGSGHVLLGCDATVGGQAAAVGA
jgi:hypothetical protein